MGKREFLCANHYTKIFCFCVHSGAPDLMYPGTSLYEHIFVNRMHLEKNRTYARTFPVQYVVLGARLKVINLNILPESSRNKLKYSLKKAFMFSSIILKFQVPDINILLWVRKKATVFDGPWSANVVLSPRLR